MHCGGRGLEVDGGGREREFALKEFGEFGAKNHFERPGDWIGVKCKRAAIRRALPLTEPSVVSHGRDLIAGGARFRGKKLRAVHGRTRTLRDASTTVPPRCGRSASVAARCCCPRDQSGGCWFGGKLLPGRRCRCRIVDRGTRARFGRR